MSTPLHPQNVIAMVWDFDKTLIPGYMQEPIFKAFGVDETAFWREVNALPGFFARLDVTLHPDTAYLNHLLTYVHHGRMPGLTNARLRELGGGIVFHPGLPDFFERIQRRLEDDPEARRFELRLEHYVVSTGLKAMIEGSAIKPFVKGIWASEFLESPAPPGFDPDATVDLDLPTYEALLPETQGISQIAVAYDNTSKTRALFEINKGSNVNATIEVNSTMRPEDRRVPFHHMIYIADGPSDVPAFSVMRQNHGTGYAVYDPANPRSLRQVDRLRRDGRIDHYGPADYREGSPTSDWLMMQVERIAAQIVEERKSALKARVGEAPHHLPH
ncbi:HAD family hydrolase [Geothrix sp. 21YS21S-2]|uniref:HAD family hydrolase n=1 Tax=Geothrix sp. 21YS21S-2 TaxID=3068893 RepID=UPI0027B9EA7E|nr:HAD family hydrolase [Geothrix sp. 21YS21S-2]